jgi:tetratricopeptide (TPR) repeat protein
LKTFSEIGNAFNWQSAIGNVILFQMHLRLACLFLSLLLLPFQSPRDSIRQYYEAAEAHHRAGNLVAAEADYVAILVEGYQRLGAIYTAQANYQGAVAALETAATYRSDSPQVLVELAIAYFYVGQYQKAIEPLTKALALTPQNSLAHHMLGKTQFMVGDFAKAEDELGQALKLSPGDYDVAYTLGLAFLRQHKFAQAKKLYDHLIVKLGDKPALRVLIGRAYRETGFFDAAIEEFKRAIVLDTTFPRVHYHLGLTYLLKEGAARLADAGQEFKLELANYPDEFYGNYYLGIVYVTEAKWGEALGPLENARRIQPSNSDPHFFLGQAYQALEKHERAIESFKKAVDLNPDLAHNDYQVTNAHYRLGQSLIKVGRVEEGRKELQISADLKSKAFKRNEAKLDVFLNTANLAEQDKFPELNSAQGVIAERPALADDVTQRMASEATFYMKVIGRAHNNIGLLRVERQDFRGAAQQFQLAAKWSAEQEGLDYNWGLACFQSELYKDAIAPFEKELTAHPDNLSVRQWLGLSYFMIEDYARASALLEQVLAARPDEVALYYPLALSMIKQGKTNVADGLIQKMLTNGNNSPQVHILMGQAYYSKNNPTKALEELQTASNLDSKIPLAHFYSGVIYLKMGKLEEASREFESELMVSPTDVQTKYNLGYVSFARQQTKRGIALMREVLQARPDYGDAHFELGKALLQEGDVKGAIQSLEMAVKLEPEEARVHFQLGRAYQAAGRKAEGDDQLELSKRLKAKERSQSTP